MTFRQGNPGRDVFKMNKVLCPGGPVLLVPVSIIIDQVIPVYLDDCGPFRERRCKRSRNIAPGTCGTIGKSHFDVPHGTGIVLQHQDIIPDGPLDNNGVDHAESRIQEQLRFGKADKILRCRIIHPVIVPFLFHPFFKFTGNRGSQMMMYASFSSS